MGLIGIAQLDPVVGDIEGNVSKARRAIHEAKGRKIKLLIFSELFLMGYPPYDLLFEASILKRVEEALEALCREAVGIEILIGAPVGPPDAEGRLFNAALHIKDGAIVGTYHKECLPFYDVFFDPRYFREGKSSYTFSFDGKKIQVVICEDVWSVCEPWKGLYRHMPVAQTPAADLLVVLSASPWYRGKGTLRESVMAEASKKAHLPIIAVNQVGGQDDLLFDGASFATDSTGKIVFRAPAWQEGVFIVDSTLEAPSNGFIEPLSFGISEYVRKSMAHDVVVGLSGGVDSAVTAALAVRALRREHVHGFFLPSRFTSQQSERDAHQVADELGISLQTISIEPIFQAVLETLGLSCDGSLGNTVVENIQARVRMLLLMAKANQLDALLLCSINKSELSVGYSTLYGDVAGALAPIGDLLKQEVYEVANELYTYSSKYTVETTLTRALYVAKL